MSVLDVLKERGYLKQMSHEDEIRELLEKEKSHSILVLTPPQIACT